MSASLPVKAAPHGEGDGDIPRHVAIIMDGNGRWANARKLPRSAGHERGVEALRRTVENAGELGLRYLTVFSFSTENWRRPASEVNMLFGLLRSYVKRDLVKLKNKGVRILVIGQREDVPADIAELIEKAESETRENDRFFLTIAFNYGAREEIARAARRASDAILAGTLTRDDLNETELERFLDTSELPDPDLIIRTSGEYRLSNFLLWQAAYSELVFVDVLWPDFDRQHLEDAISAYARRDRRYGAVKAGTG